jgi:hypothetical protein
MDLDQKWIAIVDIAKAVGISRPSLDNLKRLTKPDLDTRMDHTTKTRNKPLYALSQVVGWLNYHMPLNDAQRGRLEDSARYMLPSVKEMSA